jgi:16S rRNA (guanine527-N7)-methyltransferase
MPEPESPTLLDAVKRYDLDLPMAQVDALDRYCQVLWDWNRKLNLTRHTDYDKFVSRDLLDSLELSKLLESGERILDVGSGGGVPGIVLAVLRPDLQVELCESVAKKSAALESIVGELDLRAAIHHIRAEEVLEDSRFDTLTARAVGPLWKILKWFEPHWMSIGRLLLIKGPKWTEERGEARHRGYLNNLEMRRAATYPLAGTTSESVILKIWRKGRAER